MRRLRKMIVVLGAVVGSTFALQVAAGELTSTAEVGATHLASGPGVVIHRDGATQPITLGAMRLDVAIGPASHQVTVSGLHRPAARPDRYGFGEVHRSTSSSTALGLTGADLMALCMTALALFAFLFLVLTFTRRRSALPYIDAETRSQH